MDSAPSTVASALGPPADAAMPTITGSLALRTTRAGLRDAGSARGPSWRTGSGRWPSRWRTTGTFASQRTWERSARIASSSSMLGLSRRSSAPRRIASNAIPGSSAVGSPVRISIGSGDFAITSVTTSSPDMPGSRRSIVATSGCSRPIESIADSPSAASPTTSTSPSASSQSRSCARQIGESSTTNTRRFTR